jgi:hypothetical protein
MFVVIELVSRKRYIRMVNFLALFVIALIIGYLVCVSTLMYRISIEHGGIVFLILILGKIFLLAILWILIALVAWLGVCFFKQSIFVSDAWFDRPQID